MNTETLHLILSAGLVAAAAALDVAANLMLARSDGFKKRLIGIAALALVGLAFYCLSLAVQYMDLAVGLDLSVGYLELADFNHTFRIMETAALRVKDPAAIVVFG